MFNQYVEEKLKEMGGKDIADYTEEEMLVWQYYINQTFFGVPAE